MLHRVKYDFANNFLFPYLQHVSTEMRRDKMAIHLNRKMDVMTARVSEGKFFAQRKHALVRLPIY